MESIVMCFLNKHQSNGETKEFQEGVLYGKI